MLTCAHSTQPWNSTLPTLHLLQNCRTSRDVNQIHARIVTTGFISNISLTTKIILNFCSSLHHPPLIEFARCLFFSQFSLQTRTNLFLWNTILKTFSHGEDPKQAVLLFCLMLCRGVSIDKFTFSLVLKACSRLSLIKEGLQIQSLLEKSEFGSEVFLRNSLINVYLRCGHVESAHQVFDAMPERDSVSWNAMIHGYAKRGMMDNASEFFCRMPSQERNSVSWNSIVNGFLQSEDGLKTAWELFDEMPLRDIVSWNLMIDGCVKCGKLETAQYLFDQMPERDAVTWASLIDGYVKFGRTEKARHLFDRTPDNERDIITWNAMIAGYVQNGECLEALVLFHDILNTRNLVPDNATLVFALSAVSKLGQLDEGKKIHEYIKINGLYLDRNLAVSLIDMYSKCGNIKKALLVFKDLYQKKSVDPWNAMINGLAIHGLGELAIELFIEMKRQAINPDDITFIAVLNACAHTGLVKEGLICFELMRRVHGVRPNLQHYGCMVDILGRAGQLEVAKKLIQEMPIEPNEVIWRSLLSSCNNHGNYKMGVWVAKHLMELDFSNSSSYVLLSNLYAGFGVWNNVSRIRCRMKEKGIKKIPGCSWIEIEGRVNEFFVGDMSHPQRGEINSVLIRGRSKPTDKRMKTQQM